MTFWDSGLIIKKVNSSLPVVRKEAIFVRVVSVIRVMMILTSSPNGVLESHLYFGLGYLIYPFFS